MILPHEAYTETVKRALAEDIGAGDITTVYLKFGDMAGEAELIAKDEGIIAGLPVAEAVFRTIDPNMEFNTIVEDGAQVRKGTKIATIRGRAASLLSGERVALNFLQQLSGVATYTFMFVRAVKGSKAVIKDTRKTSPGMRALEKYAVRMGGGTNHRLGLNDAILLKDNHIDLAGGITEAVRRVRESNDKIIIETETRDMDEVREALDAHVDIIMLDNMSLQQIEDAVELIGGKAVVEVSGNVNLLNVTHIASLGVDVISVGAITHSPDALDISMVFTGLKK